MNPPFGDLVLSGVFICTSLNLYIPGVKFNSRLTFEYHVPGIVSCISYLLKKWYIEVGEACLCGQLCVAPLLQSFVLPILEYCSPVWGLLLNVFLSFLSPRCIRRPGFALIRLSCRCVIDVMLLHCVYCTRLIWTRIIVCSMSFHLFLSEFDIPELQLQPIH